MKRSVPAIIAAIVLALIAPVAAGAAVEVISLRYRSAAELLPIVRSLLSTEGKISADERTNSLIIVDSDEAVARVIHSLATLDAIPRQVTVRVRFQESTEREEHSASAGLRVSGDQGAVAVGRPPHGREGVQVRAEERSRTSSGGSEQFISTLSGSWAFIQVGREVPFTARWSEICRRHGRTVVFQRMETGFEVKAVLLAGMAEVEIVPRISGASSSGRSGEIRFAQASTRVQVPTGRWISIGGSEQGANEVVRAILESGGRRHFTQLGIELMVEER
jgi:type II secretory pathway component GspD/PulD (secretin)